MTASETRAPAAVAAAYTTAIVGAEALVAAEAFVPALLLHTLLVLAPLNHFLLVRERWGPLAAPLVVLPLVPLLRILSLTTAQEEVPELGRYVLTGAPLLLATAIAAAFVRPRRIALLRPRAPVRQAAIALVGIPLGWVAYRIADPEPLAENGTIVELAIAAGLVFVCAGVAEELVFRGLLLETVGPVWSTLLFAAVYLAVEPTTYLAFIVATGAAFALFARWTESAVGVAAAHGALLAGALVVWPAVT